MKHAAAVSRLTLCAVLLAGSGSSAFARSIAVSGRAAQGATAVPALSVPAAGLFAAPMTAEAPSLSGSLTLPDAAGFTIEAEAPAARAAASASPAPIAAPRAAAAPVRSPAEKSPAANASSAKPVPVESLRAVTAAMEGVTAASVAEGTGAQGYGLGISLIDAMTGGASSGKGASAVVARGRRWFGFRRPALERPRANAADGDQRFEEGSVFGWKPIEKSPNHGFPPLDWAIRRLLSRKDSRFDRGFSFGNAAREDAEVFLYGERHTDEDLIARNMERLARDMKPGRGAVILIEGYLGRDLRGTEAVRKLEKAGLSEELLRERGVPIDRIELRGWDEEGPYLNSNHFVLEQHMNLLALNHLAYGELRGWRYYREVAKAAWKTYLNWKAMRHAAITLRNEVLDRAVAAAVAYADRERKTVHAIIGSEHLVERPLLVEMPLLGGYRIRPGLLHALGGRRYAGGATASFRD